MRLPNKNTTTYRVKTDGRESFRRCGQAFGVEPTDVPASSLTEAQAIDLLNTDTLVVEELTGKGAPQDGEVESTHILDADPEIVDELTPTKKRGGKR